MINLKTQKMKKLLYTLIVPIALFGFQNLNAQNCDGYEIRLDKHLKAKDYTKAYSTLQEGLAECPTQKINLYNFGETTLVHKIEHAQNDAEKNKYTQELVDLIDKRIANFSDEKNAFWEGEKISYAYKYELFDKMQSFEAFKKLFDSSEDTQKISAQTVLNYYVVSLELLNEEKLGFDEILRVYFKTKKVAEDNIEIRSVEYGRLAEKLDSIKQANPKADLEDEEKQKMANAQSAKDLFLEVSESMEAVLQENTTCDNITPMFTAKFEENKDSLDWLTSAYQALASKDCYDSPILEKIEAQYAVVYRKENPSETVTTTKTRAIASSFGNGARKFKARNYSGAIADFKQALGEVSGTRRGDVAYYLALSYQKTGSASNAISWAKKAANYKPGWGAPYQLIAGIFGSNANNCGSSQFQKLATYWVAADYAKKACSVDSRACSWSRQAARSYEGTAPSQELIFSQGKKKGQSVSISCFGGATTRIR